MQSSYSLDCSALTTGIFSSKRSRTSCSEMEHLAMCPFAWSLILTFMPIIYIIFLTLSIRFQDFFQKKYIQAPLALFPEKRNPAFRGGILLSYKGSLRDEVKLHSKAKQHVVLKQHGHGDFKRTAMETINQFVSRHDYADFIRNMGGRVYNKADVLDNGGGVQELGSDVTRFYKNEKS